jgi:hypothetical protein
VVVHDKVAQVFLDEKTLSCGSPEWILISCAFGGYTAAFVAGVQALWGDANKEHRAGLGNVAKTEWKGGEQY